jgi:hypothetical protein
LNIILSPLELRVLGCLIEKESTTPDIYPLSLNTLTAACNQKTNRDPLMQLNEDTVVDTIEKLIKKSLVTTRGGAGSRVTKYAHRLNNRLLDDLEFSQPELALLCGLFLRGPQTPGELKSRCARIYAFPDTAALLATLKKLEQRPGGSVVVQLPRQPGHKESRYAHLFGGEVESAADLRSAPEMTPAIISDDAARITQLEREVEGLRSDLEALRTRFESFVKQF